MQIVFKTPNFLLAALRIQYQLPKDMQVKIASSWQQVLQHEFDKPYFYQLTQFIKEEIKSYTIYPEGKRIFAAFDACPFNETRVVILGQDPYHGPGQANGLCFSVNEGVPNPPSLRNIFTEIKNDLGLDFPPNGNLERWAKQGVLLLNATLTVRANSAGSHQNKGWENFTDEVVKQLSEKRSHLVFILWGSYAQKKGAVIDRSKHLVIQSAHPSPLSAHNGFFGSKPFSRCNDYLEQQGLQRVEW